MLLSRYGQRSRRLGRGLCAASLSDTQSGVGPVTSQVKAAVSDASRNYVSIGTCLVSSLFSLELLPSLPPSPSHRPHLTGRCDGEGGRENPPVEPELSTSAQFLKVHLLVSPDATHADRSRQGHVPGLLGCTRKQQRLAASWSVRPFGSVPSSMRVDPLINHQVCIRFTTTRSQS